MLIRLLISLIIGVIAYFGGRWFLSKKKMDEEKKKRIYLLGFIIAFVLSFIIQIIFQIQLNDILK